MSQKIPDLSGVRIGEYEIGARVGVGGMGAVYEGKQPVIGKRVAVKVLLPTLSNETELVERFLSEARAVNEIRHRGIVDIFSFGQLPDGSHYFVMEYLQGEAFDRIIKKRAPLPLGEALNWAEETLDALDAAHAAGIIHRDIKPSNIFLVNTGRGRPYVKLLDFGIAKLGAIPGEATPQTRASVILGTPDYISPEQARGKPISPQTDLYAMGCVLFELTTGERVFRGENTLATMWMHVEDKPPVPSSINPEIPPELDEVILWCLEKEPPRRPPSAGTVRDALTAIRQKHGVASQLTPPPVTGSTAKPLAHTPPPSVRSRVAASTPSGAQPPLQTPAPGQGGHPPASGKRPGSAKLPPPPPPETRVTVPVDAAPAGNETRMAPLTALEGGALTDSQRRKGATTGSNKQTEMELDEVPSAISAGGASKLPLVLGGVGLVLVLGLVAFFALGGSPAADPSEPVPLAVVVEPAPEPKPPPVEPKPPPVEPKPPPVEPKPPPVEPKPPPVVEPKPPPVVEPKPPPVEPKLKNKGITHEQLVARFKKIEAQLAAREAEKGERDNVVRQFLQQARADIAKATSDGDRREAWSFLSDIEAQVKR